MVHHLGNLPPGTQVELAEMPEVSAVLIRANECRAVVRLAKPEREVEFTDGDGNTRTFRTKSGQTTSWSPETLVRVSTAPTLFPTEDTMSKKTTKTPKAPETATKTPAAPKSDRKAKGEVPAAKDAKPEAKEAKKSRVNKEKAKPAAEKTDRGMSALDAAAKVLAESGTPMNAKEMIEAMSAKGYWTSPGGKTPHATLYAAIIKEIAVKGAGSRFQKTERGKFGLA